jgi:hypothetical protein
MTASPLPRRPAPAEDEVLSSWIARLAKANHCSRKELCGYLDLSVRRLPETLQDLDGVPLTHLLHALRLVPAELDAMLIERRTNGSHEFIARSDFQICPRCIVERPDVHLRHWRYAWSLVCETCGAELQTTLQNVEVDQPLSSKLRMRAVKGAEIIRSAYQSHNERGIRRAAVVVTFVNVIWPTPCRDRLFSSDKHIRFTTLAAIGEAEFHPLFKAAFAIRNDELAVGRLHRAFPYHRKEIARLVGLSATLKLPAASQIHRAIIVRGSCSKTKAEIKKSSTPYVDAATKAIEILGPNATRQQLLKCAAKVLDRTKIKA